MVNLGRPLNSLSKGRLCGAVRKERTNLEKKSPNSTETGQIIPIFAESFEAQLANFTGYYMQMRF